MAVPVIADLPPAPRRNDGPPDFVLKADAMIAALHPLVEQINIALQWISGQLTATQAAEKAAAVSAKAAADSVTEAVRQVGLATEQAVVAGRERKGAEAARDSTEVVAAAVQSGAGFPALAGHAAHALRVKLDESGVEFAEVGQEIGDVLITRRSAPPPGYVLPGTLYAQAAYPELFALTGILEVNNDGANFQVLTPPLASVPISVACGKDDVFIILYAASAKRSTDGGLTWTTIPTLVGANLAHLTTDGMGAWVCFDQKAYILLRSSDNGVTWVKSVGSDIGMGSIAYVGGIKAGAPGEFVCIAYDPSNSRTLTRTVNGGASWTKSPVVSTALDGSIALDRNNTWAFGVPNGNAPISVDRLTSLCYGGAIYKVASGGGVVAKAILSGGVSVTDNITGGWVDNQGISGSYVMVDPTGCVHVLTHDGYGASSVTTSVYKSFDVGKTWIKYERTSTPYTIKAAMSSLGVWIGIASSAHYRATRLYNYDQSTQFKTPHAKAPFGMYAYIKAKKV